MAPFQNPLYWGSVGGTEQRNQKGLEKGLVLKLISLVSSRDSNQNTTHLGEQFCPWTWLPLAAVLTPHENKRRGGVLSPTAVNTSALLGPDSSFKISPPLPTPACP